MMKKKVRSLVFILTILFMTSMFYGCGGESEIKLYPYIPGGNFVTNLQASKKLISCEVTIETTDKNHAEKLFVEKNYIIRDAIVAVLREQTEEDMKDPEIQKKLSERMTADLNTILDIESIHRVFFENLVTN